MSSCDLLDNFIRISFVFLLSKQVHTSNAAEIEHSSAGRVFLVFPGAWPTPSDKERKATITIVNYHVRAAKVRITCGQPPFSFCGKSFVVFTHHQESFIMRSMGSGVTDNVIKIKATGELVVYLYREQDAKQTDSLLLFPVNQAGTMYIFPVESYSFLVVFATADKTDIYTSFKESQKYGSFNYTVMDETVYPAADSFFVVKLKKHQVFFAVHDGFEERSLISTKPILVTGGPISTVGSRGLDVTHMEECLLPASVWGKEYVVVPLLRQIKYEGYIRVFGSKDKTLVSNTEGPSFMVSPSRSYWMNISKDRGAILRSEHPIYVTLVGERGVEGNRASSFLMNIIPVEQFLSLYVIGTVATKDVSRAFKEKLVVVMRDADSSDLCVNRYCGSWTQYREDIEGYSFLTTLLRHAEHGRHIIFHKNLTVRFGVYVYQSYDRRVSATTGGMGFWRDHQACFKTPNTPDDGLDNDCDNSIDEEEFDLIDNDKDGMIDEDSLSLGSRHGQWGSWGKWLCPSKCDQKQTMWRIRACNNPSQFGTGRTCPGNITQIGVRCIFFSEECKPDCSTSKWGNTCDNPCPKKCNNNRCDPLNGTCSSCRAGYQGPFCAKECPRYHYGEWCTKSCYHCASDCDHETGQCESEKAFEILTNLLIVLVILPTISTFFYYGSIVFSQRKRRDFYVKHLLEAEEYKLNKLNKLLTNIPSRFHHRFEVESYDTLHSDETNESDFILEDDDEETQEYKILMKIYDKFSESGTAI